MRRGVSKRNRADVPQPCIRCGSNAWHTIVKGERYGCRVCGMERYGEVCATSLASTSAPGNNKPMALQQTG